MAVTVISAEWSRGVYVNFFESVDRCGKFFDAAVRALIRFPSAAIPAANTVTKVEFTITLDALSAGSDSWLPGAYNGNGLADPEVDGADLAYTRADTTSDNYGTTTVYQSAGTHTIDLGAQACTDFEVAANTGADFTIAIKQVDETGGGSTHGFEFRPFTDTDEPLLTITHSTVVVVPDFGAITAARRRRLYVQLIGG